MSIFGLVFLAIALNVDAFNVGISYGIREIKVPLKSLCTIVFISMVSISASMMVGHMIHRLIAPHTANIIGGSIFLIMGSYVLLQLLTEKDSQSPDEPQELTDETVGPLLQVRLLGIVVKVTKEPHLFDSDNSGSISVNEALLLGVALSLDSLATGIAISFAGYNVLEAALLVGVFQFSSISIGLKLGLKIKQSHLGRYLGFVPALIMLALGASRFRT